jgi:hypothetical protein
MGRVCVRMLLTAALCFSAACAKRSTTRSAASRAIDSQPTAAPETDAAPDWVMHVGQPVLPKRTPSKSEVRIMPATVGDNDYAGHTLVNIRRLVYRFTLVVPAALRAQTPLVTSPAGELHVDVSDHRLRARFVGPGWPVDEGTEVRMRGDVPGVYLFDGDGGRPLPPGQLASWFQGQVGGRAHTELIVRHDFLSAPNDGPGDLLCALLAEWTQSSREGVHAGCAGWLPNGIRFGLWSADLTAIVPMNLPRSELRADTVALPPPVPTSDIRPLLDASDLARIPPLPMRAGTDTPPFDAAVGGALSVDNRTVARVVVIVQGVPIGWVKPDVRGRFEGLMPGYYRITALRTSGQVATPTAIVRVPGELRIDHLAATQLGEPLVSSPEAAR